MTPEEYQTRTATALAKSFFDAVYSTNVYCAEPLREQLLKEIIATNMIARSPMWTGELDKGRRV